MKEEKKTTISRGELKALLFWALAGFTDSNGGAHESKMPKIFLKYMKRLKMRSGELPPMGVSSQAPLTGKTYEAVKQELSALYKSMR